jgi:CHRD domain
MRKLITVIVVLATTIAMSGVAQGGSDKFRKTVFKARLSGANEVPVVETETTGKARFVARGDSIAFELEVDDADAVFGAAGAHIHCAPAGENGPVVAFLAGPVTGGFNGSVEVEATLTAANITNPACGADIAGLVEAMRQGRTYVNVHSTAFPNGVARGQIVKA